MVDAVFDWAVVVLPALLSGVSVLVSLKAPKSKHHTLWYGGLIVFGILISLLAFWQQSRSRAAHALEVNTLNKQVGSVRDDLKTESIRRQQAERDLGTYIQSVGQSTRQGIMADIKQSPIQVRVSGGGKMRPEEELRKRSETRTQLGKFLEEGFALKNLCLTVTDPKFTCETSVSGWFQRTQDYISKNLEASYAARLLSATGLSLSYSNASQEVNNIANFISFKCTALDKFIEELRD